LRESPDALWDLLRAIPQSAWLPNIERIRKGDLKPVLAYLAGHFTPFFRGRSYTFVGERVRFEARPDQSGRGGSVRLLKYEFVRRSLLHIHPRSFTVVRRYGLLGGRYAKRNLDTVSALLRRKEEPMNFFELILRRPFAGREGGPDVGQAPRLRRCGIKSRSPPPPGAEPPRPRVLPVGRGCP